MLILQESCTDQTISFVIYALVDIVTMNMIMWLFSIRVCYFSDGTTIYGVGMDEYGTIGGSLLTVAFQILLSMYFVVYDGGNRGLSPNSVVNLVTPVSHLKSESSCCRRQRIAACNEQPKGCLLRK
ncbi:hypothetical protein SADUNF_Sadunf13G0063900 [Salix dunnii]|uniref:HD-Zip IV C-terminal domain-containing protein n=1 Tax=Salix dunnii TaxID=1413687 RepID=A0A835JJG2_9ROSI|nr:hypothetical protein SADUNF_Sadunf13G0063900 [Salix dunnii]